jgi:hypothetical protein
VKEILFLRSQLLPPVQQIWGNEYLGGEVWSPGSRDRECVSEENPDRDNAPE